MTHKPKYGWNLNPQMTPPWECEQFFTHDGECIALVEGVAAPNAVSYPHAFDSVDKVWKRGGACLDLPTAKAWAERIAGIHPRLSNEHTGTPSHPLAGVHPATRMRG